LRSAASAGTLPGFADLFRESGQTAGNLREDEDEDFGGSLRAFMRISGWVIHRAFSMQAKNNHHQHVSGGMDGQQLHSRKGAMNTPSGLRFRRSEKVLCKGVGSDSSYG